MADIDRQSWTYQRQFTAINQIFQAQKIIGRINLLKSFGLTALFWSLFTITNSVGDAIDFMERFPWYGNSDLWHTLKYFWIGFAVLTGVFALRLWQNIKYNIFYPQSENAAALLFGECDTAYRKNKKYRLKASLIFGFLLAWFIALRYILFETLLEKWSKL